MLNNSPFLRCSQLTVRYVTQRYLTASFFVQSKAAGKYARKFLVGNSGRKRIWHEGKMMANPASLGQLQVKGEGNTHRLQVLNKVFLERISDIMSTGEVSAHLSGHGVEITKVRVLPDMLNIHVYWISADSNVNDSVSKLLQETAPTLRHELSQLRILGRVPQIIFVKDQQFFKLAEVERRLSIADFGEDFEPTDATHHIKSTLTIQSILNENLMNVIKEMEAKSGDLEIDSRESMESHDLPSDLPIMRCDVLGVSTDKIHVMVRQGISKAQASHRKNQDSESSSLHQTEIEGNMNNFYSRTGEIKRWASQYRDMKKKNERRLQNKEQTILSVSPKYVMKDVEEIEYTEDHDYIEEDLPLHN